MNDKSPDIFDPRTCCYAKAIVYQTLAERSVVKKQASESVRDFRSRMLHHKHDHYLSVFQGTSPDYIADYQNISYPISKVPGLYIKVG